MFELKLSRTGATGAVSPATTPVNSSKTCITPSQGFKKLSWTDPLELITGTAKSTGIASSAAAGIRYLMLSAGMPPSLKKAEFSLSPA